VPVIPRSPGLPGQDPSAGRTASQFRLAFPFVEDTPSRLIKNYKVKPRTPRALSLEGWPALLPGQLRNLLMHLG
jgi:hypothetical protein